MTAALHRRRWRRGLVAVVAACAIGSGAAATALDGADDGQRAAVTEGPVFIGPVCGVPPHGQRHCIVRGPAPGRVA